MSTWVRAIFSSSPGHYFVAVSSHGSPIRTRGPDRFSLKKIGPPQLSIQGAAGTKPIRTGALLIRHWHSRALRDDDGFPWTVFRVRKRKMLLQYPRRANPRSAVGDCPGKKQCVVMVKKPISVRKREISSCSSTWMQRSIVSRLQSTGVRRIPPNLPEQRATRQTSVSLIFSNDTMALG